MKTYTATILLFTALLSMACKRDSLKNCAQEIVTPCETDSSQTNIRIKNNSKYDFCNVTVNPSTKTAKYGVVKSGASTCYINFDEAYWYAYIKLKIGEKDFVMQPVDYVGEQPLGKGNFTYSISIENLKSGSLKMVKD